MNPRRLALSATFAALLWAGPTPAPLTAQGAGTTIGIGPITAYREEFEGGGCDGRYVGVNVGARRTLSDVLGVEGSVAWTGSIETSCFLANDALGRPAPLDGDTHRRTSVESQIPGETFWATRLGAVVTPWASGPVTPLVRVTGGIRPGWDLTVGR